MSPLRSHWGVGQVELRSGGGAHGGGGGVVDGHASGEGGGNYAAERLLAFSGGVEAAEGTSLNPHRWSPRRYHSPANGEAVWSPR